MSGKMEGTQVNENGCGGHHNHQHEHDHHHHHGGSRVIMGSSDGHILGTMTAYTPASLPVAVMNMELSMKDASVFIKENGGVPLEIKASLKDTSSTVILNLVGTEIFRSENQESTESDASRVKCKLLAAADGIDSQLLRGALEEYMGYFVDNSF
ncbi:MAG: hypothetical protein HFH59_15235 [Lachnospiraceae bacterium]|nr:hypothetical protein [Lachnospiraceae bacterium]